MYHRGWGDEEEHHTIAKVAERVRLLLMRAIILLVILMAAPYVYGMLTSGRLDGLAGTTPEIWETIQWALMLATVFLILGVVGIAWYGGKR